MIDTEEGVKKWLADRAPAQEKLRAVIKGELPLDSNKELDKTQNESNTLDCVDINENRAGSILGKTDSVSVSPEVPAEPEILSKKKFNKVAYQREYMRKRRASKKSNP